MSLRDSVGGNRPKVSEPELVWARQHLRRLLLEYFPPGNPHHEEVPDLENSILVQLWNSYDPKSSAWRTYVIGYGRRRCVDSLRHLCGYRSRRRAEFYEQNRLVRLGDSRLEGEADGLEVPDEGALFEPGMLEQESLRRALSRLPERTAQLLRERFLEGRYYYELSDRSAHSVSLKRLLGEGLVGLCLALAHEEAEAGNVRQAIRFALQGERLGLAQSRPPEETAACRRLLQQLLENQEGRTDFVPDEERCAPHWVSGKAGSVRLKQLSSVTWRLNGVRRPVHLRRCSRTNTYTLYEPPSQVLASFSGPFSALRVRLHAAELFAPDQLDWVFGEGI